MNSNRVVNTMKCGIFSSHNQQFWRRMGRIPLLPFLALALLWMIVPTVDAQQMPKVSFSPDTANVGDPFTLEITLPGAQTDRITWPLYEEGSLGDFVLLEADTLSERAAKKFGGPTLRLTLAVYDTGRASTGEIALALDGEEIILPERTAMILTVLSDSAGTQFRPLKAQEDLPITFWDMVRYIGPWLLGLIAIVLAWWLMRKWLRSRRKALQEEQPPPVPPYDEALAALARLRKDNPLARGDQKGYVSALVQIVKRLLERSHSAPVLEMTTGEVRRWVREKPVRFDYTLLIELLDAADGVKFARLPLEAGMGDSLLRSTEQMVEAYKPRLQPLETDEEGSSDQPDITLEETSAAPAKKHQTAWHTRIPGKTDEGVN